MNGILYDSAKLVLLVYRLQCGSYLRVKILD